MPKVCKESSRSEGGSEISEDNWQVKTKMFLWKISISKGLRNTTQGGMWNYIQTVATKCMHAVPIVQQ